jgi:hypothetical protein
MSLVVIPICLALLAVAFEQDLLAFLLMAGIAAYGFM